jgi:putative Holliday junction resolvase
LYANCVRVLAIDLGERRVGFAVSDATAALARPLQTMARDVDEGAFLERVADHVSRLAAEEDGLAEIVVGLPRRLDGSPTEQTARALAFAESLAHRVDLPVRLQDERLTSREAESRLALGQRDWRRRKERLDAAAAAVILQDYLDHRAGAARRG